MPVYNNFLELEKLTSVAQRAISCQSKKRKIKPVGNTKIETKTKTKLSSIMFCLLIQVSLKSRPSKKTNVIEVDKGAI